MELLAVDALRVTEGAIGAVLLFVVVAILAIYGLRSLRSRRAAQDDPGTPTLARFVDGAVTDATTFGGGATVAHVLRRRDCVAYGYLAVAEEYESDGGTVWSTLTVTVPGRVPFLVADNRAVLDRPNTTMDAPHHAVLLDAAFDDAYTVGAEEAWLIPRILTAQVRGILLADPVQRLMLRKSVVLLRTFDGVALDDATTETLTGIVEKFLSSTPSFITPARDPSGLAGRLVPDRAEAPLPPGLYGPG